MANTLGITERADRHNARRTEEDAFYRALAYESALYHANYYLRKAEVRSKIRERRKAGEEVPMEEDYSANSINEADAIKCAVAERWLKYYFKKQS